MKHIGFYIACMVMCYSVYAQSDASGRINTSGQCWSEVDFTQVIKPKYVGGLDLYANFSNNSENSENIVSNFTQYGARAWLHYYLKPRIKLSGGFGIWQSRDIDDLEQIGTREYRLSAQGMYILVKPRITFYNWLRIDGRWIQNTDLSSYRFSSRLLYVPKLLIPLNSKIIREHVVYLILQDEMVVNLDQEGFINQNTAKLGIGYAFTKSVSLEMAYNNQQRFSPSTPTYNTNAINITLTINNVSQFFPSKKE
jgi:hypothetical protein